MNSICVFLAVLAVASYGEARVPRDAPAQPTLITDLITQAQNNMNSVAKTLQEHFPDQETVVNTIKTQSNTLATNVQSYVNQVTEEVKAKSPELEKLWSDVKANLLKTVEDMKAQLPDSKEQIAQVQAKFQEGVNVLVQTSDKANKAISANSGKVQEDIAKFAKGAVDMAVQASQQLNEQLHQAAVKKP